MNNKNITIFKRFVVLYNVTKNFNDQNTKASVNNTLAIFHHVRQKGTHLIS